MTESTTGVDKKPYLSPSQIEMYRRCGWSWKMRYIDKLKIPPGIAMLKGRAVHVGAEHNWKQKIESHEDMKRGHIQQAAAAAFEGSKKGGYELTEEEKSIGHSKVLGEALDRTVIMSGAFADKIAPQYQPTLVEQSFKIEIPAAPYDISGRVDMVDDQNRIPDLKTSGKKKQQSEADQSIQLTTYAAGIRIKTGKPVTAVGLDVLVDTKTPQVQQLVSKRERRDFEILVNQVNAVTAGIQAGVFLPAAPGSWWCSNRFCGYFNAGCPFVNSERKAAAEKNGD